MGAWKALLSPAAQALLDTELKMASEYWPLVLANTKIMLKALEKWFRSWFSKAHNVLGAIKTSSVRVKVGVSMFWLIKSNIARVRIKHTKDGLCSTVLP